MYCTTIVLTFLVTVLLFGKHRCSATSAGHGIWEYLFMKNSYNKEVRPVKQWNTTTVVNISVAVIAVVDFNEIKQTLILTTKLTLVWKDEYLTWDPSNFENVSHIHVSQSKVWTPFIFLENSVSKQTESGTPSLQVLVHNDGSVEWKPVEVYQCTCAADVRKFPFDTQTCSMIFESLGSTGNELKMQSVEDHIDFHGTGTTAGWSVVETYMEAIEEEGADIHISCSLTLRRNPTYFILNIFLPIVVLSFLNICVFILPVQSGEKASFVITVFLSLAVFLTIVSSNLPANSDSVSILNIYVFISTLLSVIIAILTILQIRIYHRNPERHVPVYLAKLAAMCTSIHISSVATDVPMVTYYATKGVHRRSIVVDVMPLDDIAEKVNQVCDVARDMKVTWPQVVKAFDNIFLCVFLITNGVMTTVIFMLAIRNEGPTKQADAH